jgi:3alpha(or 20beta)-hydroxysteroid dehydrogenase
MGCVDGKVVIVTGGTRGMGAAHVRLLHAEGARVVFTASSSPAAGAALEAELGSGARFLVQDVRSEADWIRVVATAESAFGPIDGLVNNAAVVLAAPIEAMPLETFRTVLDVNTVGPFLGIKTVAPSMRRAGGGSIVNVSSIAGRVAARTSVAYGASKFALTGITKAAAYELGSAAIRINTIYPGAIDTQMTPNAPQLRQAMMPRIPLGRIASPGEVSSLVLYLISDQSSYCTGADFAIDGGFTAT